MDRFPPRPRGHQRFARIPRRGAKPGDLVTLSGGLGAGKTALARTIVRSLTGEPDLEVPSPTFTLMQLYDGPRGPIVHADFYRLSGARSSWSSGWDETRRAFVLVEWPEKAEEDEGAPARHASRSRAGRRR